MVNGEGEEQGSNGPPILIWRRHFAEPLARGKPSEDKLAASSD